MFLLSKAVHPLAARGFVRPAVDLVRASCSPRCRHRQHPSGESARWVAPERRDRPISRETTITATLRSRCAAVRASARERPRPAQSCGLDPARTIGWPCVSDRLNPSLCILNRTPLRFWLTALCPDSLGASDRLTWDRSSSAQRGRSSSTTRSRCWEAPSTRRPPPLNRRCVPRRSWRRPAPAPDRRRRPLLTATPPLRPRSRPRRPLQISLPVRLTMRPPVSSPSLTRLPSPHPGRLESLRRATIGPRPPR